MKEYSKSKEYVEKLLAVEPENLQAKSLLNQINSKVAKGMLEKDSLISRCLCLEGIIGLALLGGALAAATGLIVASMRNRPNK